MKKWEIKRVLEREIDSLPEGVTIPEAGTSESYVTGTWRTFKPVINFEKCTQCLFCFIFCPDTSILVEDGKVVGVDLKHCKGCGICAAECPRDAISMVEEREED